MVGGKFLAGQAQAHVGAKAMDGQPVLVLVDLHAYAAQALSRRLDAVGFLDAQMGNIGDGGCAFGKGRHHGHGGHEIRALGHVHGNAVQRSRQDGDALLIAD